ncbi:MAG: HD domain-containing protein [Candidatus Latescibacteria bacterium]|jgi:HD-GYP domain-containing protein (c-di-GMP phosphodiesterase class II)|nr:HD domain-containing protein [Candidatus Latescibacterota bacterium]
MPHTLYKKSRICLDRLIIQGPIMKYLERLRQHHDDSYDHSLRVALMSIDLGYENRLTESEVRTVGYAGLLHDLGKTAVDSDVLSKPAALNAKERMEVQEHPRMGYLQLEEGLFRKIKMVVAGHHEFQTQPFPRSSSERRTLSRVDVADRREPDASIARLTEIVAISDMLDALASRRSYKAGFSREETESILRRQFTGDPVLIDQVLNRF